MMWPQNTLNVRSSVKGAGRARDFVQEFCQAQAIPPQVAADFCIILDEVLPCLVKITTSPRTRLTITQKETAVEFEIRHTGPAYDISDKDNIQWPADRQDARISDVSLQIIHRLLDGISCQRVNDENTTLLTIRQSTQDANRL